MRKAKVDNTVNKNQHPDKQPKLTRTHKGETQSNSPSQVKPDAELHCLTWAEPTTIMKELVKLLIMFVYN